MCVYIDRQIEMDRLAERRTDRHTHTHPLTPTYSHSLSLTLSLLSLKANMTEWKMTLHCHQDLWNKAHLCSQLWLWQLINTTLQPDRVSLVTAWETQWVSMRLLFWYKSTESHSNPLSKASFIYWTLFTTLGVLAART